MIRKYLLLTVAGTIFYTIFGWFVFDLILGAYTDQYTTHIPGFKKSGADYSVPFLLLSCAAYSALITYIITGLAKATKTLKGLTIGAVTGLLVAVMTDSYWLASSNFYSNISVAVLDMLAAAVTVGMLGMVIAFLSSKMP